MAKKNDLKGKQITVVGLGLHGGALGNIEWLHKQGAKLTVTDLKTKDELFETVEQLKKYSDIQFVLGAHREEDFTGADMVIRNPAVPRRSKYLQKAREVNVPIEMDSSLFFKYSRSKNIIGVTGSKGKSTSTQAIAKILKETRGNVVMVGIEGTSPLAMLKKVKKDTVVVFELSSWRLEALEEKRMSPKTAVVTSIYRDHLNTYDSFDDYVEMKKTIIRYQKEGDMVLLNGTDPILRSWESECKGQIFWYSADRQGRDSDGIYIKDDEIVLVHQRSEQVLMRVDSIPFASQHERVNTLPAILLAHIAGANPEKIKKSVSKLQALPHRLEKVREFKKVTYINDSAATMPDATIAALQSLRGERIVHILGGSDKELIYNDLAKEEKKSNITALIFLPGEATTKLKKALRREWGDKMPVQYDVVSMEEAVTKAVELAETDDVVLLSPAATSFGLFKHEFDRGEKFKKAVAQIS